MAFDMAPVLTGTRTSQNLLNTEKQDYI